MLFTSLFCYHIEFPNYDQSIPLWLDVWGEHMHHGFYPEGKVGTKTHVQAQFDLVEEMLRWGEIEKANHILDAGCGVGGSARLLAKKYDAQVFALTLSPVQGAWAMRYKTKGYEKGIVKFGVFQAKKI